MTEIHLADDGFFYCKEHVPPEQKGPTLYHIWEEDLVGPTSCKKCDRPLDCGCHTGGCLVIGTPNEEGWVLVESCDECGHYVNDWDAAKDHFEETKEVCKLDEGYRDTDLGLGGCERHFHGVLARGPKTPHAKKQLAPPPPMMNTMGRPAWRPQE